MNELVEMKLNAIFWTDPYGQTELIVEINNNTKSGWDK